MKTRLLLTLAVVAIAMNSAAQNPGPATHESEPPPAATTATELSVTIVPVNRVKNIESYPEHMWQLSGMVKIDFEVHLRNASQKPIKLHDEWNSWGYFNLKFEIGDIEGTRYWISKKPAVWYRNFETATELKPGDTMIIPVNLTDEFWNGLAPIREVAKKMIFVRALYEQYPEMTRSKDPSLWRGTTSSSPCEAAKVLPDWSLPK